MVAAAVAAGGSPDKRPAVVTPPSSTQCGCGVGAWVQAFWQGCGHHHSGGKAGWLWSYCMLTDAIHHSNMVLSHSYISEITDHNVLKLIDSMERCSGNVSLAKRKLFYHNQHNIR